MNKYKYMLRPVHTTLTDYSDNKLLTPIYN